ncbi:MAG: septum formation initiator family protein [Gudongella sp.]|jgi:cell division protein FtsB|nr:septum formation initiator family protein [Gudongella sp.]
MTAARVLYNDYPEYIEKKETIKEVQKRHVYVVNRGMFIYLAIIILFTSLFILSGYAKITSMRVEITKLENSASDLTKLKKDLAGNLEGLKNTTVISEQARNNLGMIYPENGQVEYVSLNEQVQTNTYKLTFNDRVKSVLGIFSSLF